MIARLLARLRELAAQERHTWRQMIARSDLADARQELNDLEGRYATECLILEADHRNARAVLVRRIEHLEGELAATPGEVAQ